MAKIDVQSNRETYAIDYTKSDTDRAVFFGNPVLDNLFTAVTVLGAEVWALRRRAKITEKLLEQHQGAISVAMIQKYVPTPEEENAWAKERNELVGTLLASFTREADVPYGATIHPTYPPKGG